MHKHTADTPFHERHDEELLTLEEIAEIPKASEHTLRWWRQQGKGPECFTIGKRLYTTVGDLRAFIRKQRHASKPIIGRPKGCEQRTALATSPSARARSSPATAGARLAATSTSRTARSSHHR